MGTSTGKSLPKGGDWTPLKLKATNYAKSGETGKSSPYDVVSAYIGALGGKNAFSHGNGKSNSAGGRTLGKSARSAGKKLGAFLSDFSKRGLDRALTKIGLSHLVGKSVDLIISELLDLFTDPANTLDEHATRIALGKLLDELIGKASSYDDIDRILKNSIDQKGLTNIIAEFLGNYIFEIFCRDFYEDWLKKIGSRQTKQRLSGIKDTIFAEIEAKFSQRGNSTLELSISDAERLTNQVLQDTLDIFVR